MLTLFIWVMCMLICTPLIASAAIRLEQRNRLRHDKDFISFKLWLIPTCLYFIWFIVMRSDYDNGSTDTLVGMLGGVLVFVYGGGLLATSVLLKSDYLRASLSQATPAIRTTTKSDYDVSFVTPPPPPPFHPDQQHLQQLCHTLMGKFPGLIEPKVYVRPPSAFAGVNHLAHAIGSDVIEFNESYVNRSEQETIDTMTHELLHCGIHCHKVPDDDMHGDKFEMACKLLNIRYSPSWRKQHENDDPLDSWIEDRKQEYFNI